MFKIAKGWIQLVDGLFLIATGLSVFDLFIALGSYSLKELFTVDKIGSLIVSIVVCLFWIGRYVIIRNRNRKEEKLLDLEIKIKEMHLNREDMSDEIKKLLKHSDNGSSNSDRSHKI